MHARRRAHAASTSPSSAPPTASEPSAPAACAWCEIDGSHGHAGVLHHAGRRRDEGDAPRTPKLRQLRRGVMELYISDHPLDCLTCAANGDCELQDHGRRRSACARCATATRATTTSSRR